MKSLQEAISWFPSLERCASVTQLREAIANPSTAAHLTSGGRSACWKCFLLFQNTEPSQWPRKLSDTRAAYESLRERFLRPLENPAEADSSDPLSDEQDSPWDALRKDESIRREIDQDVDRCMPENLFFRKPETQSMLLDVLFIWAKLNPDTGYRQGMHELLAPILWVVEKDAIDPADAQTDSEQPQNSSVILALFDSKFIAHDCFTLFTQVMKEAKLSYEVSEAPTADDPRLETDRSSMIARSNRIVFELLEVVDPPLSAHLKNIDIVPQVFLMRWIRLLFGREFPFDEMLQIWDRIFALGNKREYVDLTCVAMLLRIRWQLIDADYNEALITLLRFPELPKDHPPASVVDDAEYLRKHFHFDGGYEIIKKRTGKAPQLTAKPKQPRAGQAAKSSPSRSGTPVSDRSSNQQGVGFEALLNEAARGINARGERWGVYKTVRDVAGEVRKNVSTIQSRAHSRIHSRNGSTTNGGSRENLLQKLDALNARNKSLAGMLEGAVADLWKYQQNTADIDAAEKTQVDVLTKTIAKVQFVQIYLEDASLELPAGDIESTRDWTDTEAEASVASSPKASTSASGKHDANPSSSKDNKDSSGEGGQPKEAKHVSQMAPQGAIGNGSTSSPKSSTRPSLEQSSYSWMLGQEPTSGANRSHFVSPSPFSKAPLRPKNASRGSAFLFGAEDDDFGATSSSKDAGFGGGNVASKPE